MVLERNAGRTGKEKRIKPSEINVLVKRISSFNVSEAVFNGLYQLELQKSEGEKIVRQRLRSISADFGFPGYWHGAKPADVNCMSPIMSPLEQLMDYAKDRMVNGEYSESKPREPTGRDRHLTHALEEIFRLTPGPPGYIRNSSNWVRDTDLSHTITCLQYLFRICDSLRLPSHLYKISASAMIVHDCAYPKTRSYKDFTHPANRLQHMENAARAFREYAILINRDSANRCNTIYYSSAEIEEVCSIVEQHDYPGIPRDFKYEKVSDPRLLFVQRESDRLWMLDKGGFALDLLRGLIENGRASPKDRLDLVINDHCNEPVIYLKHKHKCRKYMGRPTIYRTAKGFAIFKELITQVKGDYGIA